MIGISTPRCAHCGQRPGRHEATEFSRTGRFCRRCITRLQRRRGNGAIPAPAVIKIPLPKPDGRLYVGPGGYRLPVLNQHVSFSEYTPRLASWCVVREFKQQMRRAS